MKIDIFGGEWQPKNIYCNVGVAIVGAAAVGAAGQAFGASKAADAQTAAANKAADTSIAMYQQTRTDLAPFRDVGTGAATELNSRMPFLTSPIKMDEATLRNTPGYQFNKTQGLKAVQNSAAARGLGVSGAALKGAAAFATGLADSTYQNQFNNENTNRTNAYNRLKGLVDTGENASAQTGTAGTAAANKTADAQIGAGNAQAAEFNTIGTGINNVASAAGFSAYKGLYGSSPATSTMNQFPPMPTSL